MVQIQYDLKQEGEKAMGYKSNWPVSQELTICVTIHLWIKGSFNI